MTSKKKSLLSSELFLGGLASAIIHCMMILFGCVNIFKPQAHKEMFMNIEIAGASELQEALDSYEHSKSIIPTMEIKPEPKQPPKQESPSEPEKIQEPITPTIEEPIEIEKPLPEPISPLEPIIDDSIKDQLVSGPSIVEPKPEPESTSQIEETIPVENGLPNELKAEQEKLEQQKLEQEKLEEQKRLQERKLKEQKEKKLKEKRRQEKLKKKKEAAKRKKQRLAAIKKIQKKKKSRINRLAKINKIINNSNNEKKKAEQRAKQKTNDDFNNMLNSMTGSNHSKVSGFGNGLGSYGDGMGISDSDAAIISNQIIPHWVVAGGVKNAETLRIRIRIKVKNNGEVTASNIEIIDKERYNNDHVFKSAADSAKRAILQASPLKIPHDKMHLFRDFEFSFNTDKALGVKK